MSEPTYTESEVTMIERGAVPVKGSMSVCKICGKIYQQKSGYRYAYCSAACRAENLRLKNSKPIAWVENWEPAKVQNLDTPCWDCISHKQDSDRYPRMRMLGKNNSIHRYLYQVLYRELPSNIFVMHRCDNHRCINPEHLREGTIIDNNNDRAAKGRSARGEDHGCAKLTEKEVLEIRSMAGGRTTREIADIYKIDIDHARNILKRKLWKYI